MFFSYCDNGCEKGKKMLNEYLDKNNSAFDAFVDFQYFVEECSKSCPYKTIKDLTKNYKETSEVVS